MNATTADAIGAAVVAGGIFSQASPNCSQNGLHYWRILKAVTAMHKEYVERRNDGYYISGTRVSLDSVVYAFLRGESPEGIAESFPALDLEQIFGALAFYMANREIVDRHLRQGQRQFEALRQQARRDNPALYAKLAESRRRTPTPSV